MLWQHGAAKCNMSDAFYAIWIQNLLCFCFHFFVFSCMDLNKGINHLIIANIGKDANTIIENLVNDTILKTLIGKAQESDSNYLREKMSDDIHLPKEPDLPIASIFGGTSDDGIGIDIYL